MGKSLLDKISESPLVSVVAKRAKRSEGELFKFLYQAHKIITFIFTGKKINFGYFSCLTKFTTKGLLKPDTIIIFFGLSLRKLYRGLSIKVLPLIGNITLGRLNFNLELFPAHRSTILRFLICIIYLKRDVVIFWWIINLEIIQEAIITIRLTCSSRFRIYKFKIINHN